MPTGSKRQVIHVIMDGFWLVLKQKGKGDGPCCHSSERQLNQYNVVDLYPIAHLLSLSLPLRPACTSSYSRAWVEYG